MITHERGFQAKHDDIVYFDDPSWLFSSSHNIYNGHFLSYPLMNTLNGQFRISPIHHQQHRPHSGLCSTGTVHQDSVTLLKTLDFIITRALPFNHCAGTKAWISIMRMERLIAHPALLLKPPLIPKQLRNSLPQGPSLNLKLQSTPQGQWETRS